MIEEYSSIYERVHHTQWFGQLVQYASFWDGSKDYSTNRPRRTTFFYKVLKYDLCSLSNG